MFNLPPLDGEGGPAKLVGGRTAVQPKHSPLRIHPIRLSASPSHLPHQGEGGAPPCVRASHAALMSWEVWREPSGLQPGGPKM